MNKAGHCPIGRLHLRVQSRHGVVAERRARNIVLRQGAAIIAGLFSGTGGVTAINRIRVGFSTDSGSPELTALTPPADATIPAAALESPVVAADFRVSADGSDSVRVSVSSVFAPSVELRDVTEAGLLAGDKLYNQVVFEPVTLRPGQDVTFFWEIDFPFGH